VHGSRGKEEAAACRDRFAFRNYLQPEYPRRRAAGRPALLPAQRGFLRRKDERKEREDGRKEASTEDRRQTVVVTIK